MKPQTIALIVIALIALIIIIQNSHSVWFHLLFWRMSIPLIIIVPLMLLIGFAGGFLVAKMKGKKDS
ncbi:hypothetical protein CEE37_06065 [candidate division LCP-89 bacterium B3_LCP]|uniref:Lipopolysaccharide assembly protein A domain-containing protein n=1 Tax=candidate division LCP-89 bacterium B3_LCP TaxID=2012998 RepID=A0A532V238_UNCL8|nr:MAG: hypothetical protein CEE37_06065 [candidate division LCP-89 bacterium B3_LCP]